MNNSFSATGLVANQDEELLPKLKQLAPQHPALGRMRSKVMQTSGAQAITDYSRMHHRHNRS